MDDVSVGVTPRAKLEHLYREDGDRLWRALVAYAGNRDVASDAVSEAFAQALRRGEALHQPAAWIWRTAFRIAAGQLKARRRPPPRATRRSDPDPEEVMDLLSALRTLSARQRAAVILHHYAGYSTKEVAEILGSTGPAVRVHLSRGRRRLRELLEDEDA